MADNQPSRLSSALWIDAHTTHDNIPPLLDECPICLDDFALEDCLQITGIEGCNHRIGRTCLEKLLLTDPDEEKRCPLCRTVWKAATLGYERFTNPALLVRQLFGSAMDGMDVSNTPTSPPRAGDRIVPPEPETVIPERSPWEYEQEAELFHSMRRDIEDVRNRARDTGWRGYRFPRPQNDNTTPAENSDAAAQNRLPPYRTSTQFDQARRWGTPLRAPEAVTGQESFFNDFPPHGRRGFDRWRSHRRNSSTAFPLNPLMRAQDVLSDPIDAPEMDLSADRSTQLDRRDTDLRVRERAITQQEANLARRAHDLTVREDRINRLLAQLQEHVAERDEQSTRHREEVLRLMR